MEEIKLQDESGDKKYFTQLPSIILNHSTANDQALYWQMKRCAGENGKCFATSETLRKKLGIGKQAYNKSLNYLLKKKWIRFEGLTNGKTRPIKTYSIVDIWKQNIMEYEKISSEMAVSFIENKEIVPKMNKDKSQNGSKISPRMAVEEEPLLRITNKEEYTANADNLLLKEKNKQLHKLAWEIIDKFKEQVKKDYKQDVAVDVSDYKAVRSFLSQYGELKVESLLNYYYNESEKYENPKKFTRRPRIAFSSDTINKWLQN